MGKTFRAGQLRKKDYRKGKLTKEQRAEVDFPASFKREIKKRKEPK